MSAPQIIMIVLFAFGLGIALVKDGEPRSDQRHSFITSLISTIIMVALLWWGGFWS